MELFMVIYVLGQVAGSVGPLKYDKVSCERYIEKIEKDSKVGYDVMTPSGLTRKDVKLTCEKRYETPVVTYRRQM